jgi:hypothetical protein
VIETSHVTKNPQCECITLDRTRFCTPFGRPAPARAPPCAAACSWSAAFRNHPAVHARLCLMAPRGPFPVGRHLETLPDVHCVLQRVAGVASAPGSSSRT